jgi:hypothetical protein
VALTGSITSANTPGPAMYFTSTTMTEPGCCTSPPQMVTSTTYFGYLRNFVKEEDPTFATITPPYFPQIQGTAGGDAVTVTFGPVFGN